MESYVRCDDVSEGLRPSEVTVTVKSYKGRPEFLRVSESNLLERDGHKYLAVGVVHVDPASRMHLIEFPHEADSGATRIWVAPGDIVTEQVPA
jgi:hypothetical protein